MLRSFSQLTPRMLLIHGIYWIVFTLFFTLIWGSYDHDYLRSFFVQLWSLPARLLLVYTTVLLLIPRLFAREKYGVFCIGYLLLAIGIGVFVQRAIIIYVVEGNFLPYQSPDYFKLTYLTNTIFDVNKAAIIPVTYYLIKNWKNSVPNPSSPPAESTSVSNTANDFIFIKHESRQIKVHFAEILYIESQKNYVKIKTTGQELMTYGSISNMEERCAEHHFIRVHRSYLINIDHVTSYASNSIQVGDFEIPIGRKYKVDALNKLSSIKGSS